MEKWKLGGSGFRDERVGCSSRALNLPYSGHVFKSRDWVAAVLL